MERLHGFHKVKHEGGILITCIFYNPKTKQEIRITVDDREYPYGESPLLSHAYSEILEEVRRMPINDRVRRQRLFDNGHVVEGATIEVVKGRKYQKGDRGVVTKVYDHKDTYGRWVAEYCLTDNGMKINTANVNVVQELGIAE